MDLQLHLLETFTATSPDGRRLKVLAYERMAHDLSFAGDDRHWEPTGQLEYRLEDGRLVEAAPDGALRIARTGERLVPEDPARAPGSR